MYCRSVEELTLMQLRRSDVVITDLTGECKHPRAVCEQFYALLSQYHDIHWIFLVSRAFYSQAIELLMSPFSTLLSDVEPVENLVNVIEAGNAHTDRISKTLLSPALPDVSSFTIVRLFLRCRNGKCYGFWVRVGD